MVQRRNGTPPLITEGTARTLIADIRHQRTDSLHGLRCLIDGRAWDALGYPSWRALVVAEFRKDELGAWKDYLPINRLRGLPAQPPR